MKTKIYVPNRVPYRFSSLEEAVVTLKKQRSGFKYYDLIDTVSITCAIVTICVSTGWTRLWNGCSVKRRI